MKKIWMYLSALLCLLFIAAGCNTEAVVSESAAILEQQIETEPSDDGFSENDLSDDGFSEYPLDDDSLEQDFSETDFSEDEYSGNNLSDEDFPEEEIALDEDGSYTGCDEVALYIHTYGRLPKNFITKQEAEDLGWVSSNGNLHEVAPGMSIGGNRFGNYERQLPDGKYKECDINYSGGYRGDERIVYSEEGNIYYTDDHYATFTQLYSSEE